MAAPLFVAVLSRPKDFMLSRRQLFWFGVFFMFSAFLGAKIVFLALHFYSIKRNIFAALFSIAGWISIGVPIGGFLFLLIYSAYKKLRLSVLADYAAPFLILMCIIQRIGCFSWGCCCGKQTGLPWAYPFFGGSPRHPTQVYEIIYAIGIFASSRYLYKKMSGVGGLTFFYTLSLYYLLRIFNEFFRDDSLLVCGAIRLPYLAFGILSLAGICGMIYTFRKSREKEMMLKELKNSFFRFLVWAIFLAATLLALLLRISKLI